MNESTKIKVFNKSFLIFLITENEINIIQNDNNE